MTEDNTNKINKIDFLLVGAPKCATTWINKCLEEHPEICVAKDKTIHFFNKEDNLENSNIEWKYPEGIDAYLDYFKHCGPGQKIGECAPKYLYDKDSPALIHKHFPDVKIIISLRNPVDRTFSNYNHIMTKHPGYFDNFEQALEKRKELIDVSMYHNQLQRYFDIFPRENIAVLIYEDIKKDELKFIQSIFKFLEINDEFIPNAISAKINVSKARYSQSNQKIKRIIFKLYNFATKIPILKRIIIPIKNRGANVKILNSVDRATIKDKKRPTMKPETRKKLLQLFREDVEQTEQLIGRRIDEWRE